MICLGHRDILGWDWHGNRGRLKRQKIGRDAEGLKTKNMIRDL